MHIQFGHLFIYLFIDGPILNGFARSEPKKSSAQHKHTFTRAGMWKEGAIEHIISGKVYATPTLPMPS